MNTIAIGQRLRKLRGDMSADAVAEAVGISRASITNYELGIRVPRDDIKARLARYFGTTIEELFYEKTKEPAEVLPMTLSDLASIDRDYLIPSEVAPILGCDQYAINVAARQQPEALGFAVVRVGNRVKIPKLAFLRFMRYGNAPVIEDAEG